jgi:hypothetical protein
VHRAYELWRKLESLSGEILVYFTGTIDENLFGSELFLGSQAACKLNDLSHEMSSAELTKDFPAYRCCK